MQVSIVPWYRSAHAEIPDVIGCRCFPMRLFASIGEEMPQGNRIPWGCGYAVPNFRMSFFPMPLFRLVAVFKAVQANIYRLLQQALYSTVIGQAVETRLAFTGAKHE